MEFTSDEKYWIERTADIECAKAIAIYLQLAMNNKSELTHDESILEAIKREYRDLILFLSSLRTKLDLERKKDDNKNN